MIGIPPTRFASQLNSIQSLAFCYALVTVAVVSFSAPPITAGEWTAIVREFGIVDPSLAGGQLPEIGHGTTFLETSIPGGLGGANVGQIVGANRFYANGITGQGSITANVEAGHIWNGHETLGHVSQYSHHATAWDDLGTVDGQQADLLDRHATWVGMHIGGRNGGIIPGTHQTGIAPNTDLRSGAIASLFSGTAYTGNFNFNSDSFVTPYLQYFGSADVINSSWGGSDTFGINGFVVALDGLANSFPSTTFVAAAGNAADPDRDPVTPPLGNSLGYPASGYNSIAVAALQNDGSNNYDSVPDFSSRGPQNWGYVDAGGGIFGCIACRAAVDIAAPGTALISAYYGGQTGGNNPTLTGSPNGPAGGAGNYSIELRGTSFAAPIVSGGAALLASASYNTPNLAANPSSRDARVVKAVLQNSASKIPGWDNDQFAHPNGNGGVLTVQSMDFASGTGALNLNRAYGQYLEAGTQDVPGTLAGSQGLVDSIGWDFGRVQDGTDNIYFMDDTLTAGTILTTTLTWFRDRHFNPQLFQAADAGEADLDLFIRDSISGEIISESISAFNNVEHLHFALPRTSKYQIEVNFFGALFGSLTAEEYGLAWTTAVPEPGSGILFMIGLVAVMGRNYRRR